MEMKYIVYITINQCNGKFYIGVHRTNPDVFDGYIGCGVTSKKTANKKYPFHKAVRKYGYENFKRTTIAVFPDTESGEKQAYALEKTLVNDTLLHSKEVYNACLGGNIPTSHKLQEKRVYKFSLDGNFLRSYASRNAAARDISEENWNSIAIAIGNCCLGKSNSACGFYWSYYKIFDKKDNQRKTPVAQYAKNGKFIRYYDSITEPSNIYDITNIPLAIAKKYLSGGYQWRYYKGDTSNITAYKKYDIKYCPIIMMFPDGKTSKVYKDIDDCVNQNPALSSTQIRRVLKGQIKSTKGYKFILQDQDIV